MDKTIMKVRNFNQFIPGSYYIYTGTKRCGLWNQYGEMDFVLQHRILKCLRADHVYNATFRDRHFSWKDGFDNWIEVDKYSFFKEVIYNSGFFYSVMQNKVVREKDVIDYYSIPENEKKFNVFFELTRPPLEFDDCVYEEKNYGINVHKIKDEKLKETVEKHSCGCSSGIPGNTGLDLKDVFACSAMGALLSDENIDYSKVPRLAYDMAEAMMEEREKRRKGK